MVDCDVRRRGGEENEEEKCLGCGFVEGDECGDWLWKEVNKGEKQPKLSPVDPSLDFQPFGGGLIVMCGEGLDVVGSQTADARKRNGEMNQVTKKVLWFFFSF